MAESLLAGADALDVPARMDVVGDKGVVAEVRMRKATASPCQQQHHTTHPTIQGCTDNQGRPRQYGRSGAQG